MHIGTHSGRFHADEVFAIAALSIIFPDMRIARTREKSVLAGCDMRIDVGGVYQATTGDFDHHQARILRPNGVAYSSFGLIWKHFGELICDSADVARILDERLVQPIDLRDTGEAKIDDRSGYSVSEMICAFNPTWDERRSVDDAFREAVRMAKIVLRNAIRKARARIEAKPIVRDALARRTDPHVLALPQGLPWHSIVALEAPEVRYVIYVSENDGRWRVEGVPASVGAMAVRLPFPRSWRGKSDAEMAAASGVADAVFCHLSGYLAAAMTRQGAQRLAEISITSRERRDE